MKKATKYLNIYGAYSVQSQNEEIYLLTRRIILELF